MGDGEKNNIVIPLVVFNDPEMIDARAGVGYTIGVLMIVDEG
jgi:hypothetical protein